MARLLATTLLVASSVGCNKVAPQAGKAIFGLEKSAVKASPLLERGGAGAAQAEGRAGMAAVAAEQGAKSAAQKWAERIHKWHDRYEQANEAYDILCEIINGPPNGSLGRFPRPASDVKPISNQKIIIDPQSGAFALPNNAGGYNFYTPRGEPLGFCAYNTALREFHFFDFNGVRVG